MYVMSTENIIYYKIYSLCFMLYDIPLIIYNLCMHIKIDIVSPPFTWYSPELFIFDNPEEVNYSLLSTQFLHLKRTFTDAEKTFLTPKVDSTSSMFRMFRVFSNNFPNEMK